jgi:hypothetical protein
MTPSTEFYLLALLVIGPIALWLLHKVGDVVPGLLFIAVAAFDIWIVPDVPHSPVACINGHPVCGPSQEPWLIALVFVVPGVFMLIYKAVRGDKRGTNGARLP